VRKGLDWLVAHQGSRGELVGTHDLGGYDEYHKNYMYEHGIAAFALSEACALAAATGQSDRQPYLDAAVKAIRFIESQQHDDGGWKYSTDRAEPSDTSVSGWQALALKAAKEAGISVDPGCVERLARFFDEAAMDDNGRTAYMKAGVSKSLQSEATTGIGMLVRQFLLNDPDAPMIHEAAAYLAALAEQYDRAGIVRQRNQTYRSEYNYYTWYNCSLAMFRAGGMPWQRWNAVIRDTVVDLQRHGGCFRGSWDPDTVWGAKGGRIYSTALAILTLEVYYRYASENDGERVR